MVSGQLNAARSPAFDLILNDRIQSLAETPRYADILISFLGRVRMNGEERKEQKYGRVLKAMTELWVDSDKNPSIFEEAEDFEKILQRNRAYRDHFIHSFNVFSLGYFLMNRVNEVLGASSPFNRQGAIGIFTDCNLTWMLAATFHDMAYPIQNMRIWLNDILREFLGIDLQLTPNIAQILPPIYADFMRIISEWHSEPFGTYTFSSLPTIIDWPFYDELNRGWIMMDHGLLGSLMLFHRLAIREGFLENPHQTNTGGNRRVFFGSHLPACHAICAHTMKFKVKFERHPFAFLLILCDELQDWGRPSKQKRPAGVLTLRDANVSLARGRTAKLELVIKASNRRTERLNKVFQERLDFGEVLDYKITPAE